MSDALILILLSLAMFIGSFFVGSLPLIVSFSESRLRIITVLGAGLLVGTALAVIIPEGVQSIYSAAENPHAAIRPDTLPPSLHHGNGGPLAITAHQSSNQSAGQRQSADVRGNHAGKKEDVVIGGMNDGAAAVAAAETEKIANNKRRKRDIDEKGQQPQQGIVDVPGGGRGHDANVADHGHHHDSGGDNGGAHGNHHSHKKDVHGTVGVALVAGFVMMLLVDQLAQQRYGREVDLGSGVSVQPRYKLTATIGLVVHAAADGVALGAASGSVHSEIQLIVFLAIMLHKAPASFGLVTFLLHEGLDKTRIRRHLLIFALAAPVAAVVTFILISHGGNKEQLSSMHSTGILLLFSAGTFLYVATVHVLPEVAAGGHHSSSGPVGHGGSGFKLNELIALVFGAVAPTFLTLGHSH